MANKNHLYPHLLLQDIEVWEAHLAAHHGYYHTIKYDVKVGQGRDPGPEYTEQMRQIGLGLSQRRIDAVGYTDDHIDIIEITNRAGLKALGQMTGYPILYSLTYKPTLPIRQVLVAAELGTDMADIYKQANITVYLYPERLKHNVHSHSNRD